MPDEFNEQDHREYLQLQLELALSSPEHFVILGRVDALGESIVVLDITQPAEDVLTMVEQVISD